MAKILPMPPRDSLYIVAVYRSSGKTTGMYRVIDGEARVPFTRRGLVDFRLMSGDTVLHEGPNQMMVNKGDVVFVKVAEDLIPIGGNEMLAVRRNLQGIANRLEGPWQPST